MQLSLVAQPTPPVRLAEPESQKAEEQLTQHDRVSEDTAKLGSSADTFCAKCLAWQKNGWGASEKDVKAATESVDLYSAELKKVGELYLAAL